MLTNSKAHGPRKHLRVQRYVRNLPVGAGEAVMLKNQRRHNTVTSDNSGALALVLNVLRNKCGG